MSKKRRSFTNEFKVKITLEGLLEHESIQDLAKRHDLVIPIQRGEFAHENEVITSTMNYPFQAIFFIHSKKLALVVGTEIEKLPCATMGFISS